ncbi:MAG: mechanosensitive ion channel domain-containing protein [Pseudobdellovibrionaceae bacterium]
MFLMFFTLPLAAQAGPLPVLQASEIEKPLTKGDVRQLIDTLQNDKSRKDLISSLKVLASSSAEDAAILPAEPEPEILPPLAEQIGVKETVDVAMSSYDKFLNKYKLSSSLVNQAVGSVIVLIFSALVIVIVQRLLRKAVKIISTFTEKRGLYSRRFDSYARACRWIVRMFIVGLAVYTLGKIWDIGFIDKVADSDLFATFLSSFITIILVAVVAAILWEIVGLMIAYSLHKADDANNTRIQTLLPIVRNILLTVFGVLFGLVLLSEIGVNIAPLMAGAGVIGVAIGFGAQTLVKDFITGFIIVLEDNMRVGDVVAIAGNTGVVEKITLRKVQLRDLAGTVYTIPYSEITIIQNLTKDFSFYTLDIGVAYNESTDRVLSVLREVDNDLQKDPEFGVYILSALEIFGVDRFADSSVIIKARLKTAPGKQWPVGREFNRRMKIAFDAAKIEIPFPQRTVTVRHEGAAGLDTFSPAVINAVVD